MICENCHETRSIEKPHVWNGHGVCTTCYKLLRSDGLPGRVLARIFFWGVSLVIIGYLVWKILGTWEVVAAYKRYVF